MRKIQGSNYRRLHICKTNLVKASSPPHRALKTRKGKRPNRVISTPPTYTASRYLAWDYRSGLPKQVELSREEGLACFLNGATFLRGEEKTLLLVERSEVERFRCDVRRLPRHLEERLIASGYPKEAKRGANRPKLKELDMEAYVARQIQRTAENPDWLNELAPGLIGFESLKQFLMDNPKIAQLMDRHDVEKIKGILLSFSLFKNKDGQGFYRESRHEGVINRVYGFIAEVCMRAIIYRYRLPEVREHKKDNNIFFLPQTHTRRNVDLLNYEAFDGGLVSYDPSSNRLILHEAYEVKSGFERPGRITSQLQSDISNLVTRGLVVIEDNHIAPLKVSRASTNMRGQPNYGVVYTTRKYNLARGKHDGFPFKRFPMPSGIVRAIRRMVINELALRQYHVQLPE